jgi:hypothetical protein
LVTTTTATTICNFKHLSTGEDIVEVTKLLSSITETIIALRDDDELRLSFFSSSQTAGTETKDKEKKATMEDQRYSAATAALKKKAVRKGATTSSKGNNRNTK